MLPTSSWRQGVLVKILALSVVLVTLSVLAGLWAASSVARQMSEEAHEQLAKTTTDWVSQDLDSQSATAAMLAVQTAADPQVQAAFAARDREALTALTMPGYAAVKKGYGVAQMQFHTPDARSFLRLHRPEKFGDDLSSFRKTVVQANAEKQVVRGAEGGVAGLGVRAVAPVEYRGRHVGTVEYGLNLGEAFVKRVSDGFGAPAALYAPAEDAAQGDPAGAVASTLPEGFAVDADSVAGAMTGTAAGSDTTVGDVDYAVQYVPIRDSTGATVATLVIAMDSSGIVEAARDGQRLGLLVGLGVLLAGVIASVFIARRISASVTDPVREIGDVLGHVGAGDFTARASLVGDSTVRLLAQRLNDALDQVGDALGQVRESSGRLRESVIEMRSAAESVGATAHDTMQRAESVQREASSVSDNVGVVSAAAEQMSASIREISTSASDAAGVGGQAVAQTERTNEQVGRLGRSSEEIGAVVKLISSIAEQTNLLALNATIEAARAGEAGKGFAVVAGEVKELAEQTGQATGDIAGRVASIQSEAESAVSAIEAIREVINQVNGYQTTIASAVEEQSATTSEITRNVALASGGVQSTSGSTDILLESSRTTAEAAASAMTATQRAAQISDEVDATLGRFRLG